MNIPPSKTHDVVIIGAGVSGAAQVYALAKYTNIKRVALIEKEEAPGRINSAPENNSQTLHEGDIETNYNFEKAKKVQHRARFTRRYLEQKNDPLLYLKGPKMVLGVGEREVNFLEARYEKFRALYPTLEKMESEELEKREPKIIEGRPKDEPMIALYNEDGITVNYARLAATLVEDAKEVFAQSEGRSLDVIYDTKVGEITKSEAGYVLDTTRGEIQTRLLSVCAGAHSMYFAKKMHMESAKCISLLCVAGNFYYTPKYLNAKVYTVQNPKLPFSAVHGDPDILHSDKTRYGPTTRMVITLERHRWNTFSDFLSTFSPLWGTVLANVRILFDPDFFYYALKHNVLFSIPYVGNRLFAREIRKIIPSLNVNEVTRARRQGGVRPQIIDTRMTNPLNLGEAKLSGDHVLFNVTPSPGATTCVYNGLVDVRTITGILGGSFDEERVGQDFGVRLDH